MSRQVSAVGEILPVSSNLMLRRRAGCLGSQSLDEIGVLVVTLRLDRGCAPQLYLVRPNKGRSARLCVVNAAANAGSSFRAAKSSTMRLSVVEDRLERRLVEDEGSPLR